MIDYTPHFTVIGGPAPHPSDDGRMGVVLVASKSIKDVKILEEIMERPPWHAWDIPPRYKTTFTIELDHRADQIYIVLWGESYPEVWKSLFDIWGDNIQPDNPSVQIETRKAINGR